MQNKWIIRLSLVFALGLVWMGLVGFKPADPQDQAEGLFIPLPSLQIVDQINDSRTRNNLQALIPDKILMSTAQAIAEKMAALRAKTPVIDAQAVAIAAGYGEGQDANVFEYIARLPSDASLTSLLAACTAEANPDLKKSAELNHIGVGSAVSVDGNVIYVIQAGFTRNLNYNPENPTQAGTPVADLVALYIYSIQSDKASNAIGRLLVEPTGTLIPLIPGTGQKVNNTILISLALVAVFGVSLVFLGLVLKK
jgi:hypothetical protein